MSAIFRTNQYTALSTIIKNYCEYENVDLNEMNDFVDTLVTEFASDNRFFIEKLFRKGCGTRIDQKCIIKMPKNRQLQNEMKNAIKHGVVK